MLVNSYQCAVTVVHNPYQCEESFNTKLFKMKSSCNLCGKKDKVLIKLKKHKAPKYGQNGKKCHNCGEKLTKTKIKKKHKVLNMNRN